MTGHAASVLLCVSLVAGVAAPASGSATSVHPAEVQGGFQLLLPVGGDWRVTGEVQFGRELGQAEVRLPVALSPGGEVRVRLVQRGGGAAFIDAVSLDGQPPQRVTGLGEDDAVARVARRDNDLADALGRTVELVFPAAPGEGLFRVFARVEGPVIFGSPFSFPPENLFHPVTVGSAFYRYTPEVGGHGPDWPAALAPEDALFAELCRPTTGHPAGTTYGWVANDDRTLFAAVEFTPDNTRDGTKDWSSVWVRRGDEVREFRVSEADLTWGRPQFLPTQRAAYHHKLYTFEIPLHEIGVLDVAEAGDLDLAFEAYGTAAVAFTVQPSPWDFGSVLVGDTAPVRTFTVQVGGTAVALSTPWFTRSGPDTAVFPLTAGTCSDGLNMPSFSSCTFQVGFTPGVVGSFQDGIVISGTLVGDGPVQAGTTVLGQGVEPIPAVGGRAIALLIGALLAVGALVVRRLA